MRYVRKTTDLWRYQASLIALLTLLFGILMGYIKHSTAQAFLSPVAEGEVYIVERYVVPETVEQKIRAKFGPDADLMLKIATCESGLFPGAKNKTSSATGVFQVMSSAHGVRRDWLTDEDINIAIAKHLFDASGTNPWEESKHCWSKL
jgi:hypothetical protein